MVGSALGIYGAYKIMSIEFEKSQNNKQNQIYNDIYEKFILRYANHILAIMKYDTEIYGGDKKLSFDEINIIKNKVFENIFKSSKYLNADLYKSISLWYLYHNYIDDLSGMRIKNIENEIYVYFFKYMKEINKYKETELLYFLIKEFYPMYLVKLIVFKINRLGLNITSDVDQPRIYIELDKLITKARSESELVSFEELENKIINSNDKAFFIEFLHNNI